jgi:Zn-dependent protease
VAAAGPAINIALAIVAALTLHLVGYLPQTSGQWLERNLDNALVLNVALAVFNLFPLPPLDGGRILVGILPPPLDKLVAGLEPLGMVILLGVLIVLPLLGAQLGVNLNVVSHWLAVATGTLFDAIARLTGSDEVLFASP